MSKKGKSRPSRKPDTQKIKPVIKRQNTRNAKLTSKSLQKTAQNGGGAAKCTFCVLKRRDLAGRRTCALNFCQFFTYRSGLRSSRDMRHHHHGSPVHCPQYQCHGTQPHHRRKTMLQSQCMKGSRERLMR